MHTPTLSGMGTDTEMLNDCPGFMVVCNNELILNEAVYSTALENFNLCYPATYMTSEILQT
jgi:hypothetical protein